MIAHAETAVDDWRSGNERVEYEMRLNDVLPNYDDAVICTYDVDLLNASLAVDILSHASDCDHRWRSGGEQVLHQTRGFPARGSRTNGAPPSLSRISESL
jgi:hypothetical protein